MSNMGSPDLQIFMPLYNKGPFIEDALVSILSQKTRFTYEILISDDASRDDGVAISQSFMRRYPGKISVLANEQNRGCLGNTILCYERLRSKYFTVLDPDDFWVDDAFIDRAVGFLSENQDYSIYTSNTLIQKDGERRPYFDFPSREFCFESLEDAVGGLTCSTFFRNSGEISSSLGLLRSKVGTPQARLYEGDSFRSMLHLSQGKGYYEDLATSVYRITDGGIWAGQSQFISNSLNAQFFYEMISLFKGRQKDFFINKAAAFAEIANSLAEQDISKLNSDEFHVFSEVRMAIIKERDNLLRSGAQAGPDAALHNNNHEEVARIERAMSWRKKLASFRLKLKRLTM